MMTEAANSRGESVDDIQALNAEVSRLNGAVDWWNSAIIVMMVVAAVAATGLLVTQYIAFKKAGQLNTAQARLDGAKEAVLTADSKEKDSQIASLRIRAGEAEAGIATAKGDASTALAKQQSVETKLAAQQERAAVAERSLLELQERIKPRRLTDQQAANFVAVLNKLPNTPLKFGWTQGGGDEGFKFLQQLMPLFKQAQWKVPESTNEVSNHLDIQVTGIALLIPGPEGSDPKRPQPTEVIQLNPAQAVLQSAFRAIGIDLEFQRWFHTADGVPELVIGSKPEVKQ